MKRVKVNSPRTHEFQEALDLADESADEPQYLCRGREDEFAHYEESPQKEVAEALCADCPLRALCLASAKKEKPAWGVRGGVAWDMGRQVHWVRMQRAARKTSGKGVDAA